MAPADERIWESIYRLWFSIQQYIQQVDPGASPSDYAWRVEQRASIDDAIQRAFRSVMHADRRADLRRRIKFQDADASKIEGAPDQNSLSFAAYVEEQSHLEWQTEQIRRVVGPEMMETLEQIYGFHSDQWTIDNLAKKMGIQKDTLRKRLSRAFAKLRNELRFLRMKSGVRESPAEMAESFSERELRDFLQRLQLAALKGYPNPERKGCPGSAVLHEIARTRAPFTHPAYQHVKTCSPCLQEMLDFQGQIIRSHEAKAKTQRKFIFVSVALAGASLCLMAAFYGVFSLKHNGISGARRSSARVPPPQQQSSVPQLPAAAVPVIISLNFRPLAPRRGAQWDRRQPVWHLPKKLVTLEIALPFGSDDGNYLIEIRDQQHQTTFKSTGGIAQLSDGNTRLRVSGLDLSGMPAGRYALMFRHAEAYWRTAEISVP